MLTYTIACYDHAGYARLVHVQGTIADAYVRANSLALAYAYATISHDSRIIETIVSRNAFAA